ncbi:MAG: hypothetical protein RIQ60_3351 [Pseudomonadota bacterium]|jgi:O-antigen/teichoic acid export membrane protein
MAHSSFVKWANTGVRAATMGSRFLFILLLARFVEPEVVGRYGLLTATIGYSLFFIGLDFYTYSTREILKHERSHWGALLKNQLALTGVLYILFLPFSGLLFSTRTLPAELALWFYLILPLEHINQELNRLLVAISDQLVASVTLFVRHGSWAIGIVILMALDRSSRHLNYLLTAWAMAGGLAAIMSIWRLRRLGLRDWNSRIDWRWIRRGLHICLPLLIATLALRGIFTFDRYLINMFGGLSLVGVYVLFAGIAGSMLAFLDAGLFSFTYPELISAATARHASRFNMQLRRLWQQTAIFSTLYAVISLAILAPLLDKIGKPIYTENMPMYFWLLAANTLNALSMVPHYALYAQHLDRPIIVSHLVSLAAFLPACLLLQFWNRALSVPIALCLSMLVMLLWKTAMLYRHTPVEYLGNTGSA